MKKQLLSIALLSAVVSGAMAHEIGATVYSNSAKWKITGRNLVKNGDFSDLSLSDWTAIDETFDKLTTFSVVVGGGSKGKNEIKVNDGQTDLKNGIFQTITIEQGGTYIVSMKVMNTKAAGFTDFDLTGANTNYINAYYNTNGALATADGTNLSYGTGGECGGYTFSFTTDKFTEVNFPVQAPAEGQIVIDLRGLSEGLEICDVTCQAATQIYDTRIPEKRIAYINSVLNSYEFSEDSKAELQEAIAEVESLISEGADDGYDTAMENLDLAWENFVTANFSNVLNSINTGASGNYSANWDNWTGKFNKMSDASAQNAVSGWSWSTDRWCHKTAEANSPLQIQWMRGSSGTWDNIATNTTTLDKGTYFFGFQGAGGMMTLNKNRWARSQAKECAETYVFFNNDTTAMFLLPTSNDMASTYGNVIYKFEVAEDNTPVKFGIRCNIGQGQVAKDGFDVNLFHPVLYKVLVEGELKPEQKTYLGNVQAQIDALDGRIKVAEGYVAADQKTRPWGKENLQKGIVESKKRFDVWDAMSEDDRLATMDNYSAEYEATQAPYYVDGAYVLKDTTYIDKTEKALQNIIMNAGVRYLNNNFITPFVNKNAPLTDLAVAVENANAVYSEPINNSGDKETFKAVIDAAQALYNTQLVAPYSQEVVDALVAKKKELSLASDAFIASVKKDVIVDIDFSTPAREIPATVEGELSKYAIDGTKGTMNILGTFSAEMQNDWKQFAYGQGFNDLCTDVLFVGKGAAEVDLGYEVKDNDAIIASFDIWYGYLDKAEFGFYFKDVDNNDIASFCRKAGSAATANLLGLDESAAAISQVGGRNNGNVQGNICKDNNKTHFEVTLNYASKNMFVTTVNKAGKKVIHPTVAMPEGVGKATKLYFNSTYGNGERCCWLDNIVISVIGDVPSGIADVTTATQNAAKAVKKIENGQIVIVKNGKKYTVAGAQIK
ncbi:MAG: carbohydrate binding domain-containing protein [Prevotella sp.]|nr:carbohydrate binding domain-containing protein [Prevotella sp.]